MQSPDVAWDELFRWIEAELGGRVVASERQTRWRPALWIELERGDERLALYFRGARPESTRSGEAIRREARVLQQLARSGIPVPRVYGVCPSPCGIVMERCRGRTGLAEAESEEERRAVLEHYVEILARMHALDTAPYEALGFERPSTSRERGLCDLARWEATYRRAKRRPEPLIEFVLGWLGRNVPEGRSRTSFLTVDSGQFLYEAGRVTALLDLELACLGDPAADLAGLRTRDLSEPLGDLPAAYRRYFELTGEAIPASVIDYHTVRFSLYTPLAVAPLVAAPGPDLDLIQYLGWYWVYSLAAVEVLAHGMGVEIEAPALPEAAPTPRSPAHDALVGRLRGVAPGEGFRAYELDASLRIAEYLCRAETLTPALEAEDQEELAAFLGRRAGDWREAERLLEQAVVRAGAEREAELVRLLGRRAQRQVQLLGPVLRELEGASIQLLD